MAKYYTAKEIYNINIGKLAIDQTIYYQQSAANPSVYDNVYVGQKDGTLLFMPNAGNLAFRPSANIPEKRVQTAIELNNAEVESLLADLADYVPIGRTLTINGVTYDLSANRTWTVSGGVQSVNSGASITVDNTDPLNPIIDYSGNQPTNDEQDAMDNANAPDAGNPFATIADLPMGGGDVIGAASSTDNDVVLFDGITGKVIKDSGVLIGNLLTVTNFPNATLFTNALGQLMFATNSNIFYIYTGTSGIQFTNQANTLSLGTLSNTGDFAVIGTIGGSNLSGTNTGDETVNTIGALVNGATSATPNDTDLVMSVESSVAKKNTWTQIKAFLKTYFDTVYSSANASSTQSRVRSAATGLTTATPANVTATALTLAAGTWDISAMCGLVASGANVASTVRTFCISLTSATLSATDTQGVPTAGEVRITDAYSLTITASSPIGYAIPQFRVTFGSSTTLYLVAQVTYSTGTLSAFGSITAIPVK